MFLLQLSLTIKKVCQHLNIINICLFIFVHKIKLIQSLKKSIQLYQINMKNIKSTLLRIWKDPVGSKLISASLISIILIIFTYISKKVRKPVCNLWESYNQVIITLVICFFLYITYTLAKRHKTPKFLKFKTIKNVNGYDWVWDYDYYKVYKRYQIRDVRPICKKCSEPMILNSIYDDTFRCINIHSVACDKLNPSFVEEVIKAKIKESFPKETNKMMF